MVTLHKIFIEKILLARDIIHFYWSLHGNAKKSQAISGSVRVGLHGSAYTARYTAVGDFTNIC